MTKYWKWWIVALFACVGAMHAHAGEIDCVAKNTANVYDKPSTLSNVVRTVTKKDGLIMIDINNAGAVGRDHPVLIKGWRAVATMKSDNNPNPDVSGFVKDSEVRCQLGDGSAP